MMALWGVMIILHLNVFSLEEVVALSN